MRRLLKNKKAVSPVVSAVIMILVVMIAMSALFAFFVNYATDFQLGSGSSVLESMMVEDVHFTASQVKMWVYNVGKVEFKISSVYVDDALVSSPPSLLQVTYKGNVTITPSTDKIRDGAHGEIAVNLSFVIGHVYKFKIVTERGTSFEGEYQYQG